MKGIKLNARVLIQKLENMHEKSSHPQERGGRWDWSTKTGRACQCKALADLGPHTRAGYNDRLVRWRMWWSLGTGRTPPFGSIQTNSSRSQILARG